MRIEAASLVDPIKQVAPSCRAAMLVGSASLDRPWAVADLDVTGLDPTVPLGEERAYSFTHDEWPVHLVCYHPAHFIGVTTNDTLLFLFLREIRKLRSGIAILDEDGSLTRTLSCLRSVHIPTHCLQPLVAIVAGGPAAGSDLMAARLSFYRTLEALTYAWMHFDIEYRFSKPKWLLEDARLIRSERLLPLLRRVSSELTQANALDRLAPRLAFSAARAAGSAGRLAREQVEDAQSLIDHGRLDDAVWPLRMATFMLAQSIAESRGIPYRDLRDVASVVRACVEAEDPVVETMRDVLLLDTPLHEDLWSEWEATRREFLAAWTDRVRAREVGRVGNTSDAPSRIERGYGVRLLRHDGVELLDAISGTFNLPLGYDHPAIVQAVQDQLGRVTHVNSDLVRPHSDELIERLRRHAPVGLTAGWVRDVTGSTAVECAVKIAQRFTGATDVVSLFRSHHGQTQFSTGISGSSVRRQGFPGATSSISVRVPGPYCYRCFYNASYPSCGFLCVDRIREFIDYASNGSIACLIVEPILGNGGNIVPPAGYFAALQAFCRERNILIIADEVQTGLGRTGHMFASEALGLQPDIVVVAKGLGGIGVPIAAVLMRPELDVLDKHQHSFTSGANMLGLAAAHATLDVLSSQGFLEEVRRKGAMLGNDLAQLAREIPSIGDVRGMGMMWGLEIVDGGGNPDPAKARQIVATAMERHRLILRSSAYGSGNVVKVRPALIASDTDLREIVGRLSATFADVS